MKPIAKHRTRNAGSPYAIAYRRAVHQRPPAPAPELPAAEEVFLQWLLSVPPGADLEAAARAQMALIDKRAPFHDGAAILRTLLASVAGDCNWRKPVANL